MDKLWLIVLILVVSLPQLGNAATDSLVSLGGLIEEARANNPELQALRADHETAESRISWFSHIPDPIVAAEFSDNMTMYSIAQQVPFPTKIAQHRRFAENEADYYYFLYIDKEQSIIREVKQGYAELFMLHAKISATEKSIAFLEQIHNITGQKYSINEAPQAEVLMAQIRLAEAENRLILLKDDLIIVQASLNTLLNRDLEMSLPRPTEPTETVDTLSLPSLYALAQENQPQLKALELKKQRAEIRLSMARQTYLPDFAFKYTYEQKNDDLHNDKYMIGLTIPLWFWDKQRNFVRESAASLRGTSARYEMLENATRLRVKGAKTRVEKYQHTIDLYRNSVVPQAEAALKSALSAYEVNRIDFQTLLESEELLVESEYHYEEARANLFIAMAELEESIGLAQ
jgi:cobalt-zinc-cadmium efflux system outer membrane protein